MYVFLQPTIKQTIILYAIGEDNGTPLQYSCLGKSHRLRSLACYSPWGHKELDTTERLHFIDKIACFPQWSFYGRMVS